MLLKPVWALPSISGHNSKVAEAKHATKDDEGVQVPPQIRDKKWRLNYKSTPLLGQYDLNMKAADAAAARAYGVESYKQGQRVKQAVSPVLN